MIVNLLVAGLVATSGYPAELTSNDLYGSGKLAATKCSAKKGTTRASTEKYLLSLVRCLDKAWRHDAVKVKIIYQPDTKQKKYRSWPFSAYDGTLVIALANDWIKAKSDQEALYEVATAYGELILRDAGIFNAAHSLDYGGDEKLLDEHGNRLSYQKTCLSGAAARALGRSAKGWNKLAKGDELAWFTSGYQAGGPKGCNTWTASKSKVT